MTAFSIACVSAAIVALAAVDAVMRRRRNADLRRRWNNRPTRPGRPQWRVFDRLA
jgi:hypothetical protein